MRQDTIYIEKKTSTEKRKEKKKEEQTSHIYIIYTIVYIQHNGEKIVKIIITI